MAYTNHLHGKKSVLKKMLVSQKVKNIISFYGTRKFINLLKKLATSPSFKPDEFVLLQTSY